MIGIVGLDPWIAESKHQLNQLIETTDAQGGITAYAYDNAGNPIVMTASST